MYNYLKEEPNTSNVRSLKISDSLLAFIYDKKDGPIFNACLNNQICIEIKKKYGNEVLQSV